MNREETFKAIMSWYRNPNLNHKSKDLQQRELAVEKELRCAIDNFLRKRYPSNIRRDTIPQTCLTLGDFVEILKLSNRLSMSNRKKERFRLFLYSLLSFFKAMNTSRLALAFTTVVRLRGASKKTAAEFIKICESQGILIRTRQASVERHESRVFHLIYEFKNGEVLNSFEEGIAQATAHAKSMDHLRAMGLYGWGNADDSDPSTPSNKVDL